MQNRDSFDDPATDGIFANITRALAARHDMTARRPIWAGALVIATLAVLAAVLYYAYPREAALQELAAAPIIRADAHPYKIDPDNPGGMDIPHRQSVVYDALGGGERRIENLLPPPETPLKREELFAGLKTELPAPVMTETVPAQDNAPADQGEIQQDNYQDNYNERDSLPPPPAQKPIPVKSAHKEIIDATAPTIADSHKAAQTEPASGLVAAKETTPAIIGKNTHYVQLISIKDESAAAAAWEKLRAAHDVLGPLNMRVQRADLGERGIFYRLQGGPVPENEARAICKAIESTKPGGCLVVK